MGKELSKSELLLKLILQKGYPEDFSRIISNEMRTDFTANKMMNYISRNDVRPLEEVADEMMAILSERDRIRDKHISEHAQQKKKYTLQGH